MEERIDLSGPGLERVRPGVNGGAFRRPPILPVVAVFMLLAGIAIGFRFAPLPVPSPSPIPTVVANPTTSPTSPAPTNPPISYPDTVGPVAVNYTYCSDGELSTSGRLDDSSCSFLLRPANPGTPPPGSISIEQAIAAERSQPEVAAGRLVSAQLTSASAYFQPPNGEEVWVWELRVLGSFGGPCSVASDSPALLDGSTLVCGETTFVVLIDAMSGEVLLVTAAAYP